MANFPIYDPLTSEAISTPIAGLSGAINKISSALNMDVTEMADFPMTEVFISNEDRHRIYSVPTDQKGWLATPAPIFKKNGTVIDPATDSFSINYLGGSIEFTGLASTRPIDTDVITVTASFVNGYSSVLKALTDAINNISWEDINEKPATFPPTGKGEANGLAELDAQSKVPVDQIPDLGYLPDDYTPTWAEVTGKPTSFIPTSHTHDASNVTTGTLPIARGGTGATSEATARASLDVNLQTFTALEQIGITNIGATPLDVWAALPVGSQLGVLAGSGSGLRPEGEGYGIVTATRHSSSCSFIFNELGDGETYFTSLFIGYVAAGKWSGWEQVYPSLLSEATGVLPIEHGGTGGSTETLARSALKNNIQTFTSLAQIGATTENTGAEVMAMLPNGSELIMNIEDINATPFSQSMKYSYSTVHFVKSWSNRQYCVNRTSLSSLADFRESYTTFRPNSDGEVEWALIYPPSMGEAVGILPLTQGGTGANSDVSARLNLKNNLITYTSFTQLGLPATATFADVTNAMATNSILQAPVYSPSNVPNLEIPSTLFGTLIVEKVSSSPTSLWRFTVSHSNTRARQEWVGGFRGFSEAEGWGGWIQVYPQNQVISGSYTGDDTTDRVIDLGVTPRAVLVSLRGAFTSDYTSAFAVTGSPAMRSAAPILEIVNNGFKLDRSYTNVELIYNYIAWV